MIGAIAKLKIKDGERDNFIEAMGKLVEAVSNNEPDCFYYEMHETEDPLTIMMIELYQSEEAHANHYEGCSWTDENEALFFSLFLNYQRKDPL